ncbi:hypothetical protein K439DRAFT_1643374 [Ramaria rubella]|nr:hypothetical protein K439DRAFT_1643374 [Ramaria rubella]
MATHDPGYARRPVATLQASELAALLGVLPALLTSETNRYRRPLIFMTPCTPTSSSLARRIKCTHATELAAHVFQPLNHDAHEIARHL